MQMKTQEEKLVMREKSTPFNSYFKKGERCIHQSDEKTYHLGTQNDLTLSLNAIGHLTSLPRLSPKTQLKLVFFLLSPISPSPPSTHTRMHILCFCFFNSPLNSLNSRNLSLAIFLIHLFDNFVQPKSSHLEQKLCAKHFKSNL